MSGGCDNVTIHSSSKNKSHSKKAHRKIIDRISPAEVKASEIKLTTRENKLIMKKRKYFNEKSPQQNSTSRVVNFSNGILSKLMKKVGSEKEYVNLDDFVEKK